MFSVCIPFHFPTLCFIFGSLVRLLHQFIRKAAWLEEPLDTSQLEFIVFTKHALYVILDSIIHGQLP